MKISNYELKCYRQIINCTLDQIQNKYWHFTRSEQPEEIWHIQSIRYQDLRYLDLIDTPEATLKW